MSVPADWRALDGLVAGFGGRASAVPADVVTVHQVHGATVVCANDLAAGDHPDVEADALVTSAPGVVVAVKTADCVPILLVADPVGSGPAMRCWAAAVHAGWRGTVANVVGAAVGNALGQGIEADALRAAIGPSIGPCCYQVGEEVAAQLRARDLPVLARQPRPHVDLREANRVLLERSGLRPGCITVEAPCTLCHAERYHSHRADPRGGGRQLSWIGWRR